MEEVIWKDVDIQADERGKSSYQTHFCSGYAMLVACLVAT